MITNGEDGKPRGERLGAEKPDVSERRFRTVIEQAPLSIHVLTPEGVETESQLTWLRGMQCEAAQGYYFAEPLPGEAVAD